jgi:hypothetical protein
LPFLLELTYYFGLLGKRLGCVEEKDVFCARRVRHDSW